MRDGMAARPEFERGDELIWRVCEVDGVRAAWRPVGDLVRCRDCANWGAMGGTHAFDWCPVVQKCTRPSDWCCWAAEKRSTHGVERSRE